MANSFHRSLVLIISKGQDPHVVSVQKLLKKNGFVPVYIDTLSLGDKFCIDFDTNSDNREISISVDGIKYALRDFVSVWYRKPFMPVSHDPKDSYRTIMARILKENEYREVMKALMTQIQEAGVFVVNSQHSREIAGLKINQLRVAKTIGLNIPDSIVSSDYLRIENFLNKHDSGVIKLLGLPYIQYGRRVSGFFAYPIDQAFFVSYYKRRNLDYPLFLQERVFKKYEVRITIIGKSIFPVAIKPKAKPSDQIVDWRRIPEKEVEYSKVEIPVEVTNKLIKLMQKLKLEFGAVDMALTPEGKYVFFEINPNGQYLWLEKHTGVPLTKAMADLLMYPKTHSLLKK